MVAALTRTSLRAVFPLVTAAAAALVVACSSTVTGAAVRAAPGIDDDSRSPVDVDAVLLEQSRMRAITGGGDDLTVIPTMDGKQPVDIDELAASVASECRWYFIETDTFGPEIEEFHKTTYQDPPHGALISQGAAGYRDAATARRAFDGVVDRIDRCLDSSSGRVLLGESTGGADAVQTRAGDCGRDYRVKSVVLVEVTYCRYPDSVPDIVMANLLAQIPG
jgi:hypothetical protein